MSRSTSTFSLSDSAKSSAVVQRSNSLDHPPLRTRVPVCICTPAPSPSSSSPSYPAASGNQESQSPSSTPSLTLAAQPQSTLSIPHTSTYVAHCTSTVENDSKFVHSQPKSGQHVFRSPSSIRLQARAAASHQGNVQTVTICERRRPEHVDPHKAIGPRSETLL